MFCANAVRYRVRWCWVLGENRSLLNEAHSRAIFKLEFLSKLLKFPLRQLDCLLLISYISYKQTFGGSMPDCSWLVEAALASSALLLLSSLLLQYLFTSFFFLSLFFMVSSQHFFELRTFYSFHFTRRSWGTGRLKARLFKSI